MKCFNLFNYDDFIATGLVSRTLRVVLEGVGDADILISKGNLLSISYDGEYLPIGMNDINPRTSGKYTVWKEPITNQVWLGIAEDSD